MYLHRTFQLTALFVSLSFLGCGGGGVGGEDRVETYEVTGKIMMGGSPVANASVSFSPTGDYPPALGRTDSKGEFTLTTYDPGDGAAEGSYNVLVTKNIGTGSSGGAPMGHDPNNPESFEGPSHEAKQKEGSGAGLPDVYARADQTPLSAKVTPDGENHFEFDLAQ